MSKKNEHKEASRGTKWIKLSIFGVVFVCVIIAVAFWLHHLFYIDFQTYAPQYLPNDGKVTSADFTRVARETDTVLTLQTSQKIVFVESRAASGDVFCGELDKIASCKTMTTPGGKSYNHTVSYTETKKPFAESYDWREGSTGISMGCTGKDQMCTLSRQQAEKIIDSFVRKSYSLKSIATERAG